MSLVVRMVGQARFAPALTEPDGDVIGNFAIAGASSVVSIVTPDGSQVVNYNPATGTYGSVIASDAAGGQFYIVGVDPSAHTVLVDDASGSGSTRTDDVQLYNAQTGTLVGSPDLSGYTLKGGVVGAARDRADLLADDKSSGDDTVIAVSMLTGAVTTVTDADSGTVSRGSLENIVADNATGEVYATAGPGSLLCFGGGTALAEVDPGTGTATATTGGSHCDTDLAVDSAAGDLLSVSYRSVSVNIAGTSSLVVMPEANPSDDSVYPLRTGGPFELAADPVHHLALALYSLPAGPAEFGGQAWLSPTVTPCR
jgi:hypothetical protein